MSPTDMQLDPSRLLVMVVCVAACSARTDRTAPMSAPADVVVVPVLAPAASQGPLAPPWSLSASDGTGLALVRVDAKALFAGPLAFTELHLYFRNHEDRAREGTFQITLPSGAAVSRFAMENGGQWLEAEVVDKALARRAYDDFVHQGVDPALLEKAIGNQFTARVFPIAAMSDKHLVISYSQTLAGEQYVLPLRGLPKTERLDVALAITGADGRTAFQRLSKRNWQADHDFVSTVTTKAAGVVAGRLVVAEFQVGVRAAPTQPPKGITLLVDTSGSRAFGYDTYLASIRRLLGELQSRWGDELPLQIVAFDQTTQPVFAGRAADVGDSHVRALAARGAAGASDLGQALSWLIERGKPESRVVIVTDGVITAGVDGGELASRVAELSRVHVDRLDVVLAGEQRDKAMAKLLAHARLPHPGAVLDLETDPVAAALAEPVEVDIPIEVAHSTWSYPRTLASVRPGMTALVYARLDRAAQSLDITVGGQSIALTLLSTSPQLVARAIAGVEVEELEAQLIGADPARAPEVRAALANKSVASRVLSSQTSMLVLEDEADYERYKIDRKQLACTLVVRETHIDCARRAGVVLLAKTDEPAEPMLQMSIGSTEDAPVITVTSSEIAYEGQLVATTESVIRDDSPTFKVDALHDRIAGKPAAGPVVLRIDPSTDLRLVNKLINTANAAGVQIITDSDTTSAAISAAQSNAERQRARSQLQTLERQRAEVQQRVADARHDHALREPLSVEDKDALAGELAVIETALAAKNIKGALAKARAWHAREPDNVLALIGLGNALEAANDDAMAARIYGSIIDLFPGRADLRRFAGERLERVAHRRPELARALIIDTYRRAVADRPDHMTGHRLLAYALVRDGKLADAFAAILAGVDQTYRSDSYRGGTRVLADDAAMIGAAYAARVPELRSQIERDLATRNLQIATKPSTRFILYWETDANDVDLHIRDRHGDHAYYEQMALPSGGELYGDITTGYGPECFAIAGRPKAGPYRLSIHYYSRGPMGYGMGMLEIVRFDGKGGLRFEQRPYVVMNDDAFVELGTF